MADAGRRNVPGAPVAFRRPVRGPGAARKPGRLSPSNGTGRAGRPILAFELVKAYSREHVRWLTPLEKHALCAVKRKTVTGVAAGADAEEVYVLFAGAIHEKSRWILCDCLPDGFERAVIVPYYVEGRMSLRNLPNAEVPHAANCIFRLRERDEESAEHDPRFLFNPVPRDEYEPNMPGHEPDPDTGTRWRRRPPPTVAHVLKCFVQEARLNTLAVAERFASPAEWLPEIRRAAGKLPVAPDIPASEVLFTDPACLGSGEIPERLDAAGKRWPDPQEPARLPLLGGRRGGRP